MSLKHFSTYAICAVMLLSSCSSDDEPSNKFEGNMIQIPTIDCLDFSEAENATAQSLNEASIDIFKIAYAKRDEMSPNRNLDNLCVSPLSLEIALGMIANGAEGQLADEIISALGCTDVAALNAVTNKLMRYIPAERESYSGLLANSIWYKDVYNLSEKFTNVMNESYFADLYPVADFSSKECINDINQWANDKTNGVIPYVVDNLSSTLDVIMMNALYFYSNWVNPFDKDKTDKQDFKGVRGVNVVDMMHREGLKPYVSNDKYTATSLDFEGYFSMTLILPAEGTSIGDMLAEFNYTDMRNITEAEWAKVNLSLPRFSVDADATMGPVLQGLGINGIQANLRPMGIDRNISFGISQKSVTKVDEEGAVAAAVTTTGWDLANDFNYEFEDVTMTINRPFVYFITEKVSGAVLMAGCVNEF